MELFNLPFESNRNSNHRPTTTNGFFEASNLKNKTLFISVGKWKWNPNFDLDCKWKLPTLPQDKKRMFRSKVATENEQKYILEMVASLCLMMIIRENFVNILHWKIVRTTSSYVEKSSSKHFCKLFAKNFNSMLYTKTNVANKT